jgi:hypothetical protein
MLYNPCEPNPEVLSLIKDGKQATSGSLLLFHQTETLEHVRPCTAALTGLRKSVISSGNMVYNCRPWSACLTRRRSSNSAASASCRIAANCSPTAGR